MKALYIVLSFILFVEVNAIDTQLIEVQSVIPNVVLDIKYATKDNFTKEVVYPSAKCYLVAKVAQALARAAQELEQLGYNVSFDDLA